MLKIGEEVISVIKEHLKPVVLYNNSSGSNGTITLLDNVSNYEYIEIFYRNTDYHYDCAKIYKPNGKIINLRITNANGSSLWIKSNQANISGTSITISNAVDFNVSANVYTGGNSIYITRVVGYKT